MSGITFDDVTKRFGETAAVENMTLEVIDGEFMVLLGPSGCGKSTALRMIAGLEEVTEGMLSIGNRVVNNIPPRERDIAMVFQSYALYPHMSVRKNIESPLVANKKTRLPAAERTERINDAAQILGLTEYLDRKPGELSGGQRQRVALARAIVRRPQAFLMDEPLSNLDAKLRTQTRLELVDLHRRLGTTFVYVTHDQVEAMTMADRIAIINDGHVQQVGRPQEVYDLPANLFVAQFIGSPPMNTIAGTVEVSGSQTSIVTGAGTVEIGRSFGATDGTAVVLGVRPEHMGLAETTAGRQQGSGLQGTVENIEMLGHERHLLGRGRSGSHGGPHRPADRTTRNRRRGDPHDRSATRPALRCDHHRPPGGRVHRHRGGRRVTTTVERAPDRAPKRTSQKVREGILGWAFMLPALAIFVGFFYYPLYRLINMALHRENRFGIGTAPYVGPSQIVDTLTGNDFLEGLLHSGLYMLYTVPLGLILGILLAVAANRKLHGIGTYQTIFSSTVATSVAVASVIFFTLVNPEVGYFKNVAWLSLSNPDTALFSVSLSSVWQNLGLTFIIVLAALQAVPQEVEEAAALDGYGPVRHFWRITVPLISPALLFLAVVLVVFALQAYAQVELLTNGGPGSATETLLYKIADPQGIRPIGIRASMSLGLFVLTAVVAATQYGLLSRRVHYGD